MYQTEKARIKEIFERSPFTIDNLKNLELHSSKLWAKFRHIENVANLMETAADYADFSEKEKLMAFAAGQFHDIACINDVALTGREYGPRHGARGAVIAFGLLVKEYDGFALSEVSTIAEAIKNHDGATPDPSLEGFTRTLTLMLRDCDKIDCYRRLSTEPLESVFQRPLEPHGHVNPAFAERCLAGKPMRYAEMQNFNEEALLYLGWFFQLQTDASRKAALPLFSALADRIVKFTEDEATKAYIFKALNLASAPSSIPSP